MKIGDLVTLSQYGIGLEACWKYHRDWHQGKLVGLLIDIYDNNNAYFNGKKYKVLWIDQKYKGIKRIYWCQPGLFKRGDLKMFKAPKKKT